MMRWPKCLPMPGLQLHIAGHMHLNDTGVHRTSKGNTLINIQVPSLAGYPPAFKVLSFSGGNTIKVETVVLDSVPGFDTFFELYEKELAFLKKQESEIIWDKNILNAKDYLEYTRGHLKNLLHLRFLPTEWPDAIKKPLVALNGHQLLALSNIDKGLYTRGTEQCFGGERKQSKMAKGVCTSFFADKGERVENSGFCKLERRGIDFDLLPLYEMAMNWLWKKLGTKGYINTYC